MTETAPTRPPLRVALLCSDQPHHHYLLHLLIASGLDVVCTVIEPGAAQQRRRRRRFRKSWRPWIWNEYHARRRRYQGLAAYRLGYFGLLPYIGNANPPTYVADDINGRDVISFLEGHATDVTVVIGTSVLRSAVLAEAGPVVLNVHGGYLPAYRGNHCFFYPFFHGDFGQLGSSIHFVDEGIDSGDLVDRAVPFLLPDDTPESTYCRSEMYAFHRLVLLLREYDRTGTLPRQAQAGPGRTYRTQDRRVHHDVRYWWSRRNGRITVPGRDGVAHAGESGNELGPPLLDARSFVRRCGCHSLFA